MQADGSMPPLFLLLLLDVEQPSQGSRSTITIAGEQASSHLLNGLLAEEAVVLGLGALLPLFALLHALPLSCNRKPLQLFVIL